MADIPFHFYDRSFIRYPHQGIFADTPSYDWLTMWESWRLPYSLWGGTDRMRKAGRFYLPQEPRETDQAYAIRLHRTFLYNAFRRTITSLAGEPFVKSVQVDNLPPELNYLIDDADSTGNSLTEIAHWLLIEGMKYGLYHILVDYPSADGMVTLQDQREYNIRPYFNALSPLNVIGWRGERVGGVDILHEVRILEKAVEETDEGMELPVTYVRRIYPDRVEFYKARVGEGNGNPFREPEINEHTLGKIPLVTGYAERTGFMTARPPLEDLAWKNLEHWQSSSDQKNILHVARVPVLFFKGFAEGELEGAEIGAQRAIVTSNEQADGKYIEHTGQAIAAGLEDIKQIEEQMAKMGSDILYQKSVARQTATARMVDKSESLSVMQIVIRDLEHALENAFKLAGEWLDLNPDDLDKIKVRVGDDLSVPAGEANPVDEMLKLGLSENDILEELKRRGVISERVVSLPNKEEPPEPENENEEQVDE